MGNGLCRYWSDMKSRMNREIHVRFCERLKVRFLRPTRPDIFFVTFCASRAKRQHKMRQALRARKYSLSVCQNEAWMPKPKRIPSLSAVLHQKGLVLSSHGQTIGAFNKSTPISHHDHCMPGLSLTRNSPTCRPAGFSGAGLHSAGAFLPDAP